jgi:hypothetical protein
MRCKSLVLALMAVGGIASAQPGPPPPPMDTSTTTTTTTDPVPPPTDPTTVSTTTDGPPPPAPVQTVVEEPADDTRPSYLAIGLGLGYASPMALDMPNISSLRLRLVSGLTFEPALRISNTNSQMDAGTMEETDKLTALALATLVRLPLVSHGKVDLEALASAGFASSKSNPEGDYNATTTNSFALGYGVAVSYWITRHFNFSMSITNPLIDYRQTKVQIGVPNMTTKSSDTTIGIIFNPDVFMMLHLYN